MRFAIHKEETPPKLIQQQHWLIMYSATIIVRINWLIHGYNELNRHINTIHRFKKEKNTWFAFQALPENTKVK